jgi:hypothetical protein
VNAYILVVRSFDFCKGVPMMSDRDVSTLFLEFSRKRLLDDYWPRMRTCVESLSDDQVWWRPNEASNSVGNLILHLNGNLQQWVVASFGRLPDTRNRPAEFAERHTIPARSLLATLEATVQRAADVLWRLTEADLRETHHIQGYTVSGLQAVYQVVEHFALHYGQIAYITKLQRGRELGFHRELDETGRAPAGQVP